MRNCGRKYNILRALTFGLCFSLHRCVFGACSALHLLPAIPSTWYFHNMPSVQYFSFTFFFVQANEHDRTKAEKKPFEECWTQISWVFGLSGLSVESTRLRSHFLSFTHTKPKSSWANGKTVWNQPWYNRSNNNSGDNKAPMKKRIKSECLNHKTERCLRCVHGGVIVCAISFYRWKSASQFSAYL